VHDLLEIDLKGTIPDLHVDVDDRGVPAEHVGTQGGRVLNKMSIRPKLSITRSMSVRTSSATLTSVW
jgi:hypothetical protein